MWRRRLIEIAVFIGATVSAFALYYFTAHGEIPWNDATHWMLAVRGVIVPDDACEVGIWRWFLELFGSRQILLGCALGALAAGFFAALLYRMFGRRIAAAGTIAAAFSPWMWYGATSGEVYMGWLCGITFAVWLFAKLVMHVTRKIRALPEPTLPEETLYHRIVFWFVFAMAVVYAMHEVPRHEYYRNLLPEYFARGVCEEAQGKWLVTDGFCDDQIAAVNDGLGLGLKLVLSRTDEAYIRELAELAKREFPGDDGMIAAARAGARVFADELAKTTTVYRMNGDGTSAAGLKRRWGVVKPLFKRYDEHEFMPAMRRHFGVEGNAVGNRLQDEGKLAEAWKMYLEVYTEFDPGNFSAMVNMGVMLRRGFPMDERIVRLVESGLADFFNDVTVSKFAGRYMQASGPVRVPPAELEKMRAKALDGQSQGMRSGRTIVPSEVVTMLKRHNAMVEAMREGNFREAAKAARQILANPDWRDYAPANAVLGSVLGREGDLKSSERYFRAAIASHKDGRPPATLLNDFAETLRRLGKLDEAEKYARMAIAEAPRWEKVPRRTLKEIENDRKAAKTSK